MVKLMNLKELKKELTYHPDLYLDEMQWFLAEACDTYVSVATISKHLKSVDWSRKALKIKAAEANQDQRNWYLYQTSSFTSDMFVFCDESGIAQRDARRSHGWAPKGHTPYQSRLLRRGIRFNILPALTVGGLLDSLVYQGSTNLQGFTQWLRLRVLPQMNPFPGTRSVLVMDNASFHHSEEIYQLCHDAGVKLQYLPPYSPDYNPIEAFFGMMKHFVRRHHRWRTSSFTNDEDFAEFLAYCVNEVGKQNDEIRGHFKQAFAGKDLVK